MCIFPSAGLDLHKSVQFPGLSKFSPYKKNPSIYIHIPFCGFKCDYCDFYSVPCRGAKETIPDVIPGILHQLAMLDSVLNPPGYTTVYIGGGTPNVLSIGQLELLIRGITPLVERSEKAGVGEGEWTVELNPEYITEEYIRLFADYPVSRISIGVQSFQDRYLRRIGRHCTSAQIQEALKITDKLWKGDVSIDLLCCMPGQTEKDANDDIHEALQHNPEHISYYTLTLEKGTPLAEAVAKRDLEYPDEQQQLFLWEKGKSLLEAEGYMRYEVSNFSLPGKECRHNLHYWEMDPYAGCGPGAVSTFPVGRTALRYETRRQISGRVVVDCEEIDEKAFLLEYIMMGFRMTRGIEKEKFRTVFGDNFSRIFNAELQKWKDRHLVAEDAEHIALTDGGIIVLNSIILDAAVAIDNIFTA